MRQCPDCEEKDRVVIAGKVFCANCGAPWEPANKSEVDPYLVKVGLSNPPAPVEPTAVPASAPAPAPTAAPAATVAATPTAPIATSPSPPVATPAAMASTTTPPSAPISTPAPLPPLSSPTVTSSPAPLAPEPAVRPKLAEKIDEAPGSTAIDPIIPPLPPAAVVPNSDYKEQIGSEIPNLDSKDESVLTDAEFQNMSQAAPMMPPLTNSPSPAPIASPAPVVSSVSAPIATSTPVNPAQSNLPATPPIAAPQAIQPAPTQPVTPTPAAMPPVPLPVPPSPVTESVAAAPLPPAPSQLNPAAPSVDGLASGVAGAITKPAGPTPIPPAVAESGVNSTTVAGVTMSRDAAMKLALDDEIPADLTVKKAGPARPLAVVVSVIALVMLGAYMFHSNYPALALKMAGIRSGIDVSVPSYLPNGWSISRQVSASDGNVSYNVNKSNQSFKITEQKSSWDSQALLEQGVLPKSSDYLALQAEGLTIYVYGDNQATWVSGGTVYKLEGSHGLSQDEIIKIATSI